MRLLYVSHSLPRAGDPLSNIGGLQRAAVELQDALAGHPDVELTPLVLRSSWNQRHHRVPLFMARALPTIARVAAQGRVDAVLFSSLVTAGLVVPLRGLLGRRRVAAVAIANGQDVTLPARPYQALVRRILRALDLVLPISTATGEACIDRGLEPRRMRVVPLGVDVRRFAMTTTRRAARASLIETLGDPTRPVPESALLACSLGRLVKRKGFEWFIESVMPRTPPDVHYWLAGSGPEEERIRLAVKQCGLGDRIRILGRLTDAQVETLYRGADLFVMPNIPVSGDMEGLGLVMLEAGVCGLPTIGARLEGITEVIIEGTNGHLIQTRDADGFVAALSRYRKDRVALQALSEGARSHTAARFSWPVTANRYVEAIRFGMGS